MSDDSQGHVDVAPAGLGVRAHLVSLVDEVLGDRTLDSWELSGELNGQVEPALAVRPDADPAVTADSAASILARAATTLSALWKHEAYPMAKSCSGLVNSLPGPPISFGIRSCRSSSPSDEAERPSRPPHAVVSAV